MTTRMMKSALQLVQLYLLVFFSNSLGFSAPAPQSKRPNILVILIDDLRWDALGITGHPFFKSPNIDRIGNEGAIFSNAFVTHSLCSPSRATLLTGLYTHQHGVVDNNVSLNPDLPTVPKILQAAGYETAFIGKWHMGFTEAMPKPGFNRWVSFKGLGRYIDPEINVDGTTQIITGHMTDILTEFALEFLAKDRSVPFFMIVAHLAVHNPLIAQERFAGEYADANITFPLSYREDFSNKPEFVRCLSFRNDSLLAARVRRYFDTLAGVEESVGKLLNKLSEKGILDETLVIFTSDNGHFLGEHNLVDKRAAYEESIRIPLLIRYPYWFNVPAVFPFMALNLDLAPTLLDAAGIAAPAYMQGVSLRKLARGEVQRQNYLYEYYLIPNNNCIPSMRAVRTQSYKYITYFDSTRTEELYDLVNDRIEMRNLIKYPEYAEVLQRLRFQLDSLRVATGDTAAVATVDEARGKSVQEFSLYQNHPNPFNAATTISYALAHAAHIQLKLFDIHGREVATLVDGMQPSGIKTIHFDGLNLSSGIYFYRLNAGAFAQIKKLVIIK